MPEGQTFSPSYTKSSSGLRWEGIRSVWGRTKNKSLEAELAECFGQNNELVLAALCDWLQAAAACGLGWEKMGQETSQGFLLVM